MALREQGQLAEAIAAYRQVPPDSPDYFKALNNLGVLLEQTEQCADAAEVYRQAISLEPGNYVLRYNLAHVLQARGEGEAAIAEYQQTLALEPGLLAAHHNLGCTLAALGRLEEAEAAFRQASMRGPQAGPVFSRLGDVLLDQGRLPEAKQCYQRAMELSPDSAPERVDLGFAEEMLGNTGQALALYRQALELDPALPVAFEVLGRLLIRQGQVEEAKDIFQRWNQACPADPAARHLLAALTGEQVPARAETDYVRTLFDRFADRFDATLRQLDYRAPQLVATAVGEMLGPPKREAEILDAGCGTGLCGPLLRPFAKRLVGVDLSSGMIERARRRNSYDELLTAELIEHLQSTPARYDVIASADTFNYFGDLAPVIAALAFALQPGGCLAFTLEAEDDPGSTEDYRLTPEGRYHHRQEAVERVLLDHGFKPPAIERATLRLEHRQPVIGLIVRAQWPSGA